LKKLQNTSLKTIFFWFALTSKFSNLISQQPFSFDSILNTNSILKNVNENKKKYKLQIIFTQINRDKSGKPNFKNYNYNVDSTNYFYCASLVKLPCSILALEKLNDLNIDKNTTMFTDSAFACQRSARKDKTSINGYPSIANYIKRMFLVSDNFSYSRIYEFLGVDYLHNRLFNLGYKSIRIVHRFDAGCSGNARKTTNPVSFYDSDMKLLYHQKQQSTLKEYPNPLGIVKIGRVYSNAKHKKIKQLKDFTNMNYVSLQNIHSILQRLIFNEYLQKKQQYRISHDDRDFLLNYLTLYPRESVFPAYDSTFFDSYKKYFIYGDSKKPITNDDIKITNIVGKSYGFLVDCAYIQNRKENIEFMLSAVIYANEDGIMNDGNYEYDSIGLPFLAELGRQMYAYELKRKK
jgi:hypothetical protein